MSRSPVLLPPAPRARRPLPGWLVVVALAGLALLFCSTLPAVCRHIRLARDLDRLNRVVRLQEQEVRRLELGLAAAREDTFAYEQALRELIHPKRR